MCVALGSSVEVSAVISQASRLKRLSYLGPAGMDGQDRSRFQGSAEEISDAMALVVRDLGRSFLRYDEAPSTRKLKTDADAICVAGPLLLALHDICPKL